VRVRGMLDELEFVVLGFAEFGFVVVGVVELFAASRVFKRFAASSANSPFGYFFKYALKSSGLALSLIEFQKIISAAAALSLIDFAGRLVREFAAGVFFFAVVFFGVGVGVGFAMTSPPLP
jgi:hypothetical protein